MIIDSLNNINNYKGLSLFNILQYISKTNFNNQPVGKYHLDGDNLFYMISEFNTKEYKDAIWESHYRYTDIHVMLQGEETIACEDISKLDLLKEEKDRDLMIYQAPILNPYVLKPQMFAVFFTNNGHMPNLMVNNKQQMVKKIVFKVDLLNFNSLQTL